MPELCVQLHPVGMTLASRANRGLLCCTNMGIFPKCQPNPMFKDLEIWLLCLEGLKAGSERRHWKALHFTRHLRWLENKLIMYFTFSHTICSFPPNPKFPAAGCYEEKLLTLGLSSGPKKRILLHDAADGALSQSQRGESTAGVSQHFGDKHSGVVWSFPWLVAAERVG